MAQLTDRMPLTSTTNRIIEDPAPVPVLGEIASFVGNTIEGFAQLKREQATTRAARKKAEDEERDRAVTHEAFNAYYTAEDIVSQSGQTAPAPVGVPVEKLNINPETGQVFEDKGPVEVTPELQNDLTKSASRLQNVNSAVDQGRMPQVSMSAALTAEFQRLSNKYPGEEEQILDLWKKMGIDTNLFRPGRDAADQADFEREEAQSAATWTRERRQDLKMKGMISLGPAAEGLDDGQLVAHGILAEHSEYVLSQTKTRTEIAAQSANLTEVERKRTFEDSDQTIRTELHKRLFANSGPVITMLQQAAGLLATPDVSTAEQQTRFQLMANRVRALGETSIRNAVQLAMQSGYRGDIKQLENELRINFNTAYETFAGEYSVAQQNHKALNNLKTVLGLEYHEMMPVYMAIKGAGLDPNTMPSVMNGLAENPVFAEQLRNEIKGFNLDWGKDRASERVINIIRLMRGEDTLADWSTERAIREMPNLYRVNENLTDDYVANKGVDANTVVNSLGNMTFAANTLGPSSPTSSYVAAVRTLAGNAIGSLAKAVTDPSTDKQIVLATIQATRATHAHILNNAQARIAKINQASPYFRVQMDQRNGKYIIDDSRLRAAMRQQDKPDSRNPFKAQRESSMAVHAALKNARVPAEMKQWVTLANESIDAVAQLSKLDPQAPKVPEIAIRRYYGFGVPLPGDAGAPKAVVNPRAETEAVLQNLERTINTELGEALSAIPGIVAEGQPRVKVDESGARSTTNLRGSVITIPPIQELDTKFAENPNYQTLVQEAQAAGIPKEVAVRLGFVESGGDYSAGRNAAGAQGPVQVTAVHNDLSKQMFGKPVSQLTPQQNIKLGMQVLKNYYNETGSWEEAAMSYIGRGKANKNLPEPNDGQIYSRNYAQLVAGGM